MKLHYHILDVFTDTAFTGKGLAVVLGADGLTEQAADARWLHNQQERPAAALP